MAAIKIMQPSTSLKDIKGSIPSPFGELSITWEFGKTNFLSIEVPDNMNINLDLNSFTFTSGKNLKINKKKVAPIEIKNGHLLLKKGKYNIEY